MYNLIAIGDPVIDTHIQIDDSSTECEVMEMDEMKLCLDYGAKIPIVDSFQALGGNAPNVAVGAQKLGLKTALVSTVGGDMNGQSAVEELKKQGVETEFVAFDKNSKTRYSMILNYKGERTILSYTDKKTYRWPEKFPPTEWIYYTGLSEGFETVQNNLIELLTKHPAIRLVINPGSYLLKYALADLRIIIERADILIVNKEEGEKILGTTKEEAKSMEAVLRGLLNKGAKEIVLTDGLNGAWAADEDEMWHLEPYPVKVIAKTGAGDAFSAGYITARHRGHDLPHALSWGTANACSVVQQHGSHGGMLDAPGVEKMIKQFSQILAKKLD
jgi:sugar/nucleoside kinase (ribokinase family)